MIYSRLQHLLSRYNHNLLSPKSFSKKTLIIGRKHRKLTSRPAVLRRLQIAVINVVDFDATSVSLLWGCAIGMSRNPTASSSQSRRFVSSQMPTRTFASINCFRYANFVAGSKSTDASSAMNLFQMATTLHRYRWTLLSLTLEAWLSLASLAGVLWCLFTPAAFLSYSTFSSIWARSKFSGSFFFDRAASSTFWTAKLELGETFDSPIDTAKFWLLFHHSMQWPLLVCLNL